METDNMEASMDPDPDPDPDLDPDQDPDILNEDIALAIVSSPCHLLQWLMSHERP